MVNLDNLFKRIDELGLTAKKVSAATKISTGNISDWKNGKCLPTATKLYVLADYLNCSTDYLLGRTDNPNIQSKVLNNQSNNSITNTGVIKGNNSANLIVGNNNTYKSDNETKKQELSKQALEFAEIFDSLGIRQQAKLLSTLDELEKEL